MCMIKAALFDMDGLMINTEPLQSKAYEAVLVKHGKNLGLMQRVSFKRLVCEKKTTGS